MVSAFALTAAPLDTAPRPVLAMALVNAFRTELLAPAVVALGVGDDDPASAAPALDAVAPLAATAAPAATLVPPLAMAPPVAIAATPPLPLPPTAVLDVVPPPAVSKLELCVPVAAPPEVLT